MRLMDLVLLKNPCKFFRSNRQMRHEMRDHCREIGMHAECMETKQESRTLVDMLLDACMITLICKNLTGTKHAEKL